MPSRRPAPTTSSMRMANALARRELIPWILLGMTLGMVEGGTAAVLLKQNFSGHSSDAAVNFAVAMVSGAPAMANVLSFAWANHANGRARVPILVSLQLLFALLVGLIGLAPRLLGGLLFTTLSIMIARVIWAGILTVRSSVWIANYPRNTLARMTGRIVIGSALTMGVTSSLVALALSSSEFDTRALYLAAALAGIAAALLYRKTRVRREHQLLLAEKQAGGGSDAAFSLRACRTILREDKSYREYMFWMGIFGGGAVMVTSQLVVIMTEQLKIPGQTQILMLSVIPLLSVPIFVPYWARRFDRQHTVNFRAQQGWVQAGAYIVTSAGVLTPWEPLLWLGAILLGAALAGANFGWNLGHQDFASKGRLQQYMGVHVTLTGVRGMVAPPLGILFYQLLETTRPGLGRYSILLPTAITAAGAIGFNILKRKHYNLNKVRN